MGVVTGLVAVCAAYLLGALPTSYLITRKVRGIDIRSAGSGNAGATNVLRVAGKAPAVITLVVDIAKGAIAVAVLARLAYPAVSGYLDRDLFSGIMALAVVSGHIWPVFLGFRGGKGVATTIGAGIVLSPPAFIPSLLAWFAVFAITRYVSLASIVALLIFPVSVAIIDYSFYIVICSVIICAIGIYKHKDNVKRLLRGEEHKTVFKKSSVSVQKTQI